jgi:hypothetical protein
MDQSIYAIVLGMLLPGERVQWVSFHPTIILELDKVEGRRVPYEQRLTIGKAKEYIELMPHGRKMPKVRVRTDQREIFISPAEICQVVWHDHGTMEFVTLPYKELEASGPGTSR